MSAAESEESRWPDLATASIRTHSPRRTVAHRSSSAIDGVGRTPRSLERGIGCGSGTGRRWLTAARLASGVGTGAKARQGGGHRSSAGALAKSIESPPVLELMHHYGERT